MLTTRPLYLFGYGSLLWKPGPLENFRSFPCTAQGVSRVFAQRSCDHRGHLEFPGFVVTLLTEKTTSEFDSISAAQTKTCAGLVWLVPEEQTTQIIRELDYREKGGYSREFIKVKLEEATPFHGSGDLVEAVVYSGLSSNPLFDYWSRIANDPQREKPRRYLHRLRPRNPVADVIAAAHGPSGSNKDYALGLINFMEIRNMSDSYLRELGVDIRLTLGVWNGRWSLVFPNRSIHEHGNNSTTNSKVFVDSTVSSAISLGGCLGPLRLFGWGSDEQGQLCLSRNDKQERTAPYAVALASHYKMILDGCGGGVKDDLCSKLASPSPSQLEMHVLSGGKWSGILSHGRLSIWGPDLLLFASQLQVKGCVYDLDTEAKLLTVPSVDGCAMGSTHILILFTCGSVIGLGDDSHGQCSGSVSLVPKSEERSAAGSMNTTSTPRFLQRSVGQSRGNIEVGSEKSDRVQKLATGLRHSVALMCDGALWLWGDHTHGQTAVDAKSNLVSCASDHLRMTPLQPSQQSVHYWRSDDGAMIVDVACGAFHTVAVDNIGRIWTFGDNKHGSLGRNVQISEADLPEMSSRRLRHCDPTPRTIPGVGIKICTSSSDRQRSSCHSPVCISAEATLINSEYSGSEGEENVFARNVDHAELSQWENWRDFPSSAIQWLRVTCGWYHTVVRGVRPDGSSVFRVWGRRDLGQYPISQGRVRPETAPSALNSGPVDLAPLPDGLSIREVWAGSEYTVVTDSVGHLWASGWNEHGNLGSGDYASAHVWTPVCAEDAPPMERDVNIRKGVSSTQRPRLRLYMPWEGALACGGGHCVALGSLDLDTNA